MHPLEDTSSGKYYSSPSSNVIAGLLSSTIVRTAMSPIERPRLRLPCMANDPRCDTWYHSFKHWRDYPRIYKAILHQEGVFALWRGNLARLQRYVPLKTLQLVTKDEFRTWLHAADTKGSRLLAVNMGSAALAGFCLYLVPYDRYQLERMKSGVTLKSLYQQGKVGSVLYKHFGVSAFGVSAFSSISLGLFDTFVMHTEQPGLLSQIVVAQSAYIMATLITYPLDTVQRRLFVCKDTPSSTYQIAKGIAQKEGIPSFYRGALRNIFRGSGVSLLIVVYYQIQKYLSD